MSKSQRCPITVLIAARNEEANIEKCLNALSPAERIVVIDSHSHDRTAELAAAAGAEIVQFDYRGGYPKKRQWAIDTLDIQTDWVLLLDADEEVPSALWDEIGTAIEDPKSPAAFLIVKGFHFFGRKFRFGGFSFSAVLMFRKGKAQFEQLVEDPAMALDMEVHERVIVDGTIGRFRTPLVHDDFKGLEAFLDRHNRYSTWEARLRYRFLTTGAYGTSQIRSRLFGNSQERRRFFKYLAVRTPCESFLWFVYHYIFRLGFLEGRPGLIASRIRSDYIAAVRAKVYELRKARSVPVVMPHSPVTSRCPT